MTETKYKTVWPSWALKLNWQLITMIADKYEIDPCLIGAIIWVESKNVSNACRYEKHYKWLVDVELYAKINKQSKATEEIQQKTSFGVMQVMGANARESGMQDHLVKLCKPNIGITFGCRYLRRLFDKHKNIKDVIASYNAGSPRRNIDGDYVNQEYVDKVHDLYMELKLREVK